MQWRPGGGAASPLTPTADGDGLVRGKSPHFGVAVAEPAARGLQWGKRVFSVLARLIDHRERHTRKMLQRVSTETTVASVPGSYQGGGRAGDGVRLGEKRAQAPGERCSSA